MAAVREVQAGGLWGGWKAPRREVVADRGRCRSSMCNGGRRCTACASTQREYPAQSVWSESGEELGPEFGDRETHP